ncbi:MAG TPA: YraN family protein, partial [Nitrospirales bacterium]|nr:YraN family protein [Nitrospirales bacterium]
MSSMTFGKESEQASATYLQKGGYRILHRNYRIARGEI